MSKCGNNLIHELFRSLIFQFRSTYRPKTAPISSSSVSSHRWHGGQNLQAVGSCPQPTHSGAPSAGGHFDVSWNGYLSSSLCGQSGFTGRK